MSKMNGLNGYQNGTSHHGPLLRRSESVIYEDVEKTAKYLLSKTNVRPTVGIICGSGLGGLADTLQDQEVFHYKDIPHFVVSTVRGHAGRLVLGKLGDKDVVCMQGRFHAYEGYPMSKITFPVRVMAEMGIQKLIVTNACGGLNPEYKVGDIMLLKDHINLPGMAGCNPLVGSADERFGPRFVPLSDAYEKKMRDLAKGVAQEQGIEYIQEGVYVFQTGPCFETVTECRLMRLLGADATGMSTVPEVTVARQHGVAVLGISLITNVCIMDYDADHTANHEEVLETGKMRAKTMEQFISRIVELLEVKG